MTLTLTDITYSIPLRTEENGTIRVGNTRVTLETVIETYKEGFSPAEILAQYPALDLADIYEVIAYYLRHSDEVEEYLQESERISEQAVQEIRARLDHDEIHERLLERHKSKGDV